MWPQDSLLRKAGSQIRHPLSRGFSWCMSPTQGHAPYSVFSSVTFHISFSFKIHNFNIITWHVYASTNSLYLCNPLLLRKNIWGQKFKVRDWILGSCNYVESVPPCGKFNRKQSHLRASQVAEIIKNLPARQETWVLSLGQEDPLEKGIATHSTILAWEIAQTEKPCRLQSVGSQRVGHNWVTNTSTVFFFSTKAATHPHASLWKCQQSHFPCTVFQIRVPLVCTLTGRQWEWLEEIISGIIFGLGSLAIGFILPFL